MPMLSSFLPEVPEYVFNRETNLFDVSIYTTDAETKQRTITQRYTIPPKVYLAIIAAMQNAARDWQEYQIEQAEVLTLHGHL